jgi:hypothetical protein
VQKAAKSLTLRKNRLSPPPPPYIIKILIYYHFYNRGFQTSTYLKSGFQVFRFSGFPTFYVSTLNPNKAKVEKPENLITKSFRVDFDSKTFSILRFFYLSCLFKLNINIISSFRHSSRRSHIFSSFRHLLSHRHVIYHLCKYSGAQVIKYSLER